MADQDSNQDSDTGGGAHVGGDVEAQTFVGRDVNLNLGNPGDGRRAA